MLYEVITFSFDTRMEDARRFDNGLQSPSYGLDATNGASFERRTVLGEGGATPLVMDEDVAADLVQDAFVRAYVSYNFV